MIVPQNVNELKIGHILLTCFVTVLESKREGGEIFIPHNSALKEVPCMCNKERPRLGKPSDSAESRRT